MPFLLLDYVEFWWIIEWNADARGCSQQKSLKSRLEFIPFEKLWKEMKLLIKIVQWSTKYNF